MIYLPVVAGHDHETLNFRPSHTYLRTIKKHLSRIFLQDKRCNLRKTKAAFKRSSLCVRLLDTWSIVVVLCQLNLAINLVLAEIYYNMTL